MIEKIGVIGLGYVGLPLAVEFGRKFDTIGYDINPNRIQELKLGFDNTAEISKKKLRSSRNFKLSSDLTDLKKCNIYIISVPTPIDYKNKPDLKILLEATKSIGSILKKKDIIIYESTVYPGCTEEDCVPVLEKYSGLKYNKDFYCGYSPERINPGDKKRTLTKIVKITSGSNPEVADYIDNLYSKIILAGTYKAGSIKVAEAAKVIENAQRDINISFVNELSIIFNLMDLDTQEVLDAAGTKWNFLPFKPGLVGGHCIGVDPYYLTYKAKKMGYESQIITSGRKLNDKFPNFICENINKYFLKKEHKRKTINILILGVTFKENCPDIRNSKVFDIYRILDKKEKFNVSLYDPHASKSEVLNYSKIKLLDEKEIKRKYYHCIIIAVAHNHFLEFNIHDYSFNQSSLIYDIKGIYNNKNYMRL